MSDVQEETRAKIVILAAGTILWMTMQVILDFITDLAKLALVAIVLYLLFLAGDGRLCGWDDFEQARVQGKDFIIQIWNAFMELGGK